MQLKSLLMGAFEDGAAGASAAVRLVLWFFAGRWWKMCLCCCHGNHLFSATLHTVISAVCGLLPPLSNRSAPFISSKRRQDRKCTWSTSFFSHCKIRPEMGTRSASLFHFLRTQLFSPSGVRWPDFTVLNQLKLPSYCFTFGGLSQPPSTCGLSLARPELCLKAVLGEKVDWRPAGRLKPEFRAPKYPCLTFRTVTVHPDGRHTRISPSWLPLLRRADLHLGHGHRTRSALWKIH